MSLRGADDLEQTRQAIRSLCETDLYYLCTSVLGMRLLRPHVHKRPCAFLSARPWPGTEHDEILFHMPRDFYKSSIVTIGATIQDILRNQDTTVLIVNEQENNVGHFIRAIRTQFESNRKLQWLYPEIIPDFSRTKWSDMAMKVRRREGSYDRPESTVEGVGVSGTVVSKHYDTIVLDDLIGLAARESPSVMHRAKEWLKLVEHLFASQKTRQLRCVGTPWLYGDIYTEFRGRPGVRVFSLPAEMPEEEHERLRDHKDDKSGIELLGMHNTVPTFPEEFSREELDRMYVNEGSFNYSCMKLLRPLNPDSIRFNMAWLQWYRFDRKDGCMVPLVNGMPDERRLSRKDLYVASMVDPATASKTATSRSAIVTWGQDKSGNRYLLDAWAKKSATPTQICEAAISVKRRFNPNRIGWEDYTFFSTYRGIIRQMAAAQGVAIHFVPVKAGRGQEKETRIGALDGQFQSGSIYVREGLGDFLEEYRTFPASDLRDVLDASWYCLRPEQPLLRMPDGSSSPKDRYSPWHERQWEWYDKSVDPSTGYGS